MIEVKICGMTNRDDVLAALDAGADYVGFVLYPGSPRGIAPLEMVRVLDGIDRPVRAVAVCVNMPRRDVESLAADSVLHAVQLHGDESAGDYLDLGVASWRAVKLVAGEALPDPAAWQVERFVIDAAVPGRYGGTGVTADWGQARDFCAGRRAMLAGGLNPQNVAAAVAAVCPAGVDVASGVEAAPGRKDHAAVRAFIECARSAEPQ